ncbi:MAG TPA: alpha/beta hydrolase [Candidatus Acidoferrales bacterium]|nr:alpha/beta hydrolase [Candidatus Acidoferrales bacterium]
MPEFWYDADGVRLYAVEEGRGPVIAMLHGGGADHRACLPIVAPLSARYRVITPDLRSSGRSRCADHLTWDRLAEDLEALLDHAGAARAVVGGVSLGAGAALRFARRFPDRTAALVMVLPVYRGEKRGFTEHQAATFKTLVPAIARARDEGIEAFRPLYQQSPAMEAYFDAMIGSVDLASFVATNQFMASGAQPFVSDADLEAIAVSTLLVPGNDLMHPAEVAELYAARIPRCTTAELPDTADFNRRNAEIAAAIGDFCERSAAW